MPKRKKKKPSRSQVISKIQEDYITVDDYANTSNPHPSDRRNKKLNCSITNKVQKMDIVDNTQEKLEEDLKWYEKDFDDLQELVTDEDQDEESQADQSVTSKCQLSCSQQVLQADHNVKSKCKLSQQVVDDVGLVYPADIWFQLSKYIAPEDVWRFACLCHDACAVTNTVAFWRSLYYRYRDRKIKLPLWLSSELIEGIYGVRYITICALYIMYEPLRSKTVINVPIGEGKASPYMLKKQICKYTWSHGKPGAESMCYLMFEKTDSKMNNLVQFDSDIYASNFKNQTILRVFCRNFQNLPQAEIMGLQLSEVFFNVSGDMRHHKLRLMFQSEGARGSSHRGNHVTAVLDPVVWVQILHWWHPQFRKCMESTTTIINDAVF